MIQEIIKTLPGIPVYHHHLVINELPPANGKYGLIKIDEYNTEKAFKNAHYKQVSLILNKVETKNE